MGRANGFPGLALGIAGAVMLFRRGMRAEALVIGATASAYVVYASAFFDPFGSVPPGPRYLLPVVPFLAAPLAIAFRAFPLLTASLAGASACVAGAVSVTRPHIAWDGEVLYRLLHPSWWSPTVADLGGIGGWPPHRAAAGSVSRSDHLRDARYAASAKAGSRRRPVLVAFVGWVAVATQGSSLLDREALGANVGAMLLALTVFALVSGVALLYSGGSLHR